MKKICPSCGAENEVAAKFCMNCATKLSEETTESITEEKKVIESEKENKEDVPMENNEQRLCPGCKKTIDMDAKECPECGYKLEQVLEENSDNNKKKLHYKINPVIGIVIVAVLAISILLVNRYEKREEIFNSFQKTNLMTEDLNNLEFKVPSNWGKLISDDKDSIQYVDTIDADNKQIIAGIDIQDLGKAKDIIGENGKITKNIVKNIMNSTLEDIHKMDYSFKGIDSEYVFSYTNTLESGEWNNYNSVISCNSEIFQVHFFVKKNTANNPEKIAKTFFDTVNFSDYEPILNVVKISATYSGDTTAGTEITQDSDDIIVTAYYDDGSSEVLDNFAWTMNDSATLEPDKTSKFEIAYDGVTCTLKIKCSTKINKERTLKKFVERYNAMADIMKKDKNITVKKLKEEDLDENQIETGIGATIIFNQSAEDTDCRYDIKSFMWSKSPWAFTDSEVLLANIYCCLAGYSSDNDYTTIGKIVSQIGEEATTGVYGSVHTGKYMYNMSVIKKEMTVGGQLEN